MTRLKYFFTALSCVFVSIAYSQQTVPKDTQTVFTLGEVVVTGQRTNALSEHIGPTRLQQFARTDVSKALNLLPGISLSAVGPRNEAMVYLRGFDLRQVPVLIDGIPVYIPYDGYVDLARFTTFDLAEIQVSKGYTSVIYGPNALGGAINLVSRKPVKEVELNGSSGWLSGGYRSNINIGSSLGKFYIQAGASRLRRDSFPLSDKFVRTKTEEGGSRNNSWNKDDKFNVKLAYTPGKKSEYALSYIYQHGKKGTPVYAGSDTLNSQFKNPRFWQWPYWDKRSLYFISNTVLDSSRYIKTRLYYDKFKNGLNSYDDATYTKISKAYAFKSYYNDYTIGGIAEYGKVFSSREEIKATLQYKQDVHREHNEGEPVRTMSDLLWTAGVENKLVAGPRFTLLTGLGYNTRSSIKAQDYNSTTKKVSDYTANNNDAWNLQGQLQYRLDEANKLTISAARKTRFATTKDRYSYRLGTAIPNPGLQAEYAVNYELGYTCSFNKFSLQAALFYSRIHNTILMVSNVKYDSARRVWQSQLQNRGLSEYKGAEAAVEYQITQSLRAGANYTYIKRKNITNPALHFIDVPEHKFFGYVLYSFTDRFTLQGSTEYNSKRYSTTYGAHSGGYTLLNASASVHVWKWFGVEAGINNIANRNYSLAEGYPEPGRNYFANFVYHL